MRAARKLRASLRSLGTSGATVVAALALCALLVATVWFAAELERQEATGQEPTGFAPTSPSATAPPASPPATATPVPDLAPFPELTEEFSFEKEPEGIPGLGVADVTGNLKHFPTEGGFVCAGPSPTDDEGSAWLCSAPSGKLPGTYEVALVGEDPLTVLSVEATVRGVSEEEAAEFFSYVAGLCVEETNPFNPGAWVEANVASGGQVFAEGAELSIYGTREERTLQVVATDAF